MTQLNDLKDKFNALYKYTKNERMIYFVAMITEYFSKKKIRPIIVGGLSVEIYTKNNYTTYDIDLVMDGREAFNDLLINELGFEVMGRSWFHRDLEISIEIPANYLDGSEERVIELELPNKLKVYVIGLEDIIIHRLESATVTSRKNPNWTEDYEWAKRMFDTHINTSRLIDKSYISKASSDVLVRKIISEWYQDIE